MTRELEFSFNGLPVGCFEGDGYPRSPGRYRYMPYRGPGHYQMGQALARGSVKCSFNDGGSRHEFVVVSVPEYGVLQVEKIRRKSLWPQSSGPPPAEQDVAKLGFVRPPLVYLSSIVTGVLMQRVRPVPFLPGALAVPVGVPLVVVAIALIIYSVEKFRAAGTPVPAQKPTTAIVRTGPYRLSRNPIYLGFSLLQLGIASWANNLWLLATLVGAVALIHYVVIRREEEYLERRFGAEYLDYRASVRRWL